MLPIGFMTAISEAIIKKPALATLFILGLFAYNTFEGYRMRQSIDHLVTIVDDQYYNFSYEIIKHGFAGLSSDEEKIEKTLFWRNSHWDVQIVAIDTLCNEKDRVRLMTLVDRRAASDVCGIAG